MKYDAVEFRKLAKNAFNHGYDYPASVIEVLFDAILSAVNEAEKLRAQVEFLSREARRR